MTDNFMLVYFMMFLSYDDKINVTHQRESKNFIMKGKELLFTSCL